MKRKSFQKKKSINAPCESNIKNVIEEHFSPEKSGTVVNTEVYYQPHLIKFPNKSNLFKN